MATRTPVFSSTDDGCFDDNPEKKMDALSTVLVHPNARPGSTVGPL